MKTLEEQLDVVKGVFPDLAWNSINPKLKKGNVLVMSWNLFASSYLEALQKVFDIAGIENNLSPNFNYDFLTDKHVEDSIFYGRCFGAEMDFGQDCINLSRDSFNRFHYSEMGLVGAPAFVVALQLLIHPEILASDTDLSIICVADSAKNPGFREDRASPIFYFRNGKVQLGLISQDKSFEDCGCATLINLPPTP
jgi:hypothetical protein